MTEALDICVMCDHENGRTRYRGEVSRRDNDEALFTGAWQDTPEAATREAREWMRAESAGPFMTEQKHDCVQRINGLLADKNTVIATAISFSDQGRELIQIATCKADSSVRGKPVLFFASHCPFCGVKLKQEAS